MQRNYLIAETGVIGRRHYCKAATKKALPGKAGYTTYSSLDDFLKSYPVFSMNEFGERVINGRRIC
jgi:hypothetical protein